MYNYWVICLQTNCFLWCPTLLRLNVTIKNEINYQKKKRNRWFVYVDTAFKLGYTKDIFLFVCVAVLCNKEFDTLWYVYFCWFYFLCVQFSRGFICLAVSIHVIIIIKTILHHKLILCMLNSRFKHVCRKKK